jgi:hypothetical protein
MPEHWRQWPGQPSTGQRTMRWLSMTQSQSYFISTAPELTYTPNRQTSAYRMEQESPQGYREDGETQSGGSGYTLTRNFPFHIMYI